ncbi:MAG: precorrin-2 C(20)-methyltransferase [Bacillota bacterium]|nr:precorrin-2 C(20)-methyltransferase [Bacillota bacterium]
MEKQVQKKQARQRGKFYGIGAGPGAPELLTLKAVRVLQEVPVVFVPRGDAGEKSRALKIINPLLRSGQEVRELVFPMTRQRRKLEQAWEGAAQAVAAVLDAGRDSAFVTLGDSSLYSTHFYLCEALQRARPGLEVETIPGITSFSAAAALLNRPLALGRECLAVVPATRDPAFLRQVLAAFDNVVLLKVAPVLEEVLCLLAEAGRLEDAAYVCRCGMPGQLALENLAGAKELPGDYFSLILVGRKGAGEALLEMLD